MAFKAVTEILFLFVQRRIQDFSRGGGANPKGGHQPIIWPKYAEKCIKMKKIGPRERGRPKCYYVDPLLL